MFWGRSSLYKTGFQFIIGTMTLIIGIGGITGKLNLVKKEKDTSLAFAAERLGASDLLVENGSTQTIVSMGTVSRNYAISKYIVQNGDTLSYIAQKFNVSEDTIRWANGIKGDFLSVGTELDILPFSGIRYTVEGGDTLEQIATKFNAATQAIADINWLNAPFGLNEGQILLIPGGSMPAPKPVAPVVAYTPPSPSYVGGGGDGTGIPTGSFVTPVACGHGISQWLWAGHPGVDITAPYGCNILAADGGVVFEAGWNNGGGGFQLQIDHQNGFKSLYAHGNGTYFVKVGDKVTAGQPVMQVGCSGRCTGPHLHFSMSYNGILVNPASYVPL